MTGLEDFADGSTKTTASKSGDILLYLSDPSCISSFIQSILYEDSCAGVAVVDLFVAVKAVKDKMDSLARCNNEIFCRIADLNRETIAIKTGYRNLMGNMLAFLDRINDATQASEMSFRKQAEEHLSISFTEQDARSCNDGCCPCKRRDGQGKPSVDDSAREEGAKNPYLCSRHWKSMQGSRVDCLGCLLSIFRERTQSRPPFLNEALLGSFIASLLWLQKGEGFRPPAMNSKIASPRQERTKAADKSLDLSESNIQMICDICETLCGTPPLTLGPLPISKGPDPCEEPHGSNWVSRNQSSVAQTPTIRPPDEENHATRSKSRDSSRSKDDAASDGESIFEEALTDFAMPSPPRDSPGRHQVTCMGDLSNEMSGKKNVSTFTANSDTASSWVGKLTDDIKTKLRKIKSKTNVTVVERPYVKPRKTLQKLAGALEFAISANTPVGVFDVTVLQYRKRRRSELPQRKVGRLVERRGSRGPPKGRRLPTWATDMRGDAEERSFSNSDSQSDEESSDSDEDEMEEFLEIYVENFNKNDQSLALAPRKAICKTAVAKLPMFPFFEIQKRYPVFFVQEILRKTPTVGKTQWTPGTNSFNGEQIVPLNTGEGQQSEVVIRRSSSDLVIYIQVEVEGGQRSSADGLMVEYQRNSHGTQTREVGESFVEGKEKVIKLEEVQQDGESLYHVWRGRETGSLGEADERERITFEEPTMAEEEMELMEEDLENDEERVLMVKEPKEKMVTFREVLSEIFTEAEMQETSSAKKEDEPERGSAVVEDMMNAKLQADIWLPQDDSIVIQRMELLLPEWSIKQQRSEENIMKVVAISNAELEKALSLVHAIETDVVDVKLSDAIAILPQLESELRKHLHNKMNCLGELEKENSVDNFFSAVDFWPDEEPFSIDNDDSKERLNNLLNLLTDLEEAVKSNEYSNHRLALCDCNSSKIYKLLHALTTNIRKLEEGPTVTSLSQTLDIASQLDTAVREYDSIIKRQPLEYFGPEKEETWTRLKSHSMDDVPANQHLKSVRKKVFQIVEEEAIDMEGRIERDFDRLDRLERENDEAMKFLEAFLQKMERRATELNHLKADLSELASSMNSMYEKTVRAKAKREKLNTKPSSDIGPKGNQPVRETISGLLIALDNLKSRAREKNEACREILSSVGFQQGTESEKSSRRSSRSSFTAKQVETITSTVKDFKKIGRSSLYLSWTKPEGSPSISVTGYEIHVNGTLNQKVRNPARLQAVLYSVDLTKESEVELYAVVDNGLKILLASVAHLDV